MRFNSIDFAIFLPLVFILYWFVTNRSLKLQNLLIVVASFVFYGWWDWRFLILMIVSATVDYLVGIGFLSTEERSKRKLLLAISVFVNLGILAFFKYYNFFVSNVGAAFSFAGYPIQLHSLSIILPLGISFYTFQALGYAIDTYKKQITPTKDVVAYFAFLSFFPQLVAGPIERASHLLPQFYVKRQFDYLKAVDGLKQIMWGFLKKLVIADNCAEYANLVFNSPADYNGSSLALGVVFFAFQIYGDFSGYSDIAVGSAKLFGFDIMRNFSFPYFSRDIAEFWRRWHISLLVWFRNYVYIPLGGNLGSTWVKARNIFIVFVVSGFWHGANWTFVVWGALNAVYFLPFLLSDKHRSHAQIVAKGNYLPTAKEALSMIATFLLTLLGWVFFRAQDLGQAFVYISGMFSISLFHAPQFPKKGAVSLALIGIFVVVEWLGREQQYPIQRLGQNMSRLPRWALYTFVLFVVAIFMNTGGAQFIYFQF